MPPRHAHRSHPGTLYYYRLKTNGAVVQNTTCFNTLHDPSDPSDLFFTIIGDWGQGTTGEAQISALQDIANTPMIITVGDNTYPNGTQSELDNNAMAYYQSPLQRAFYFPTLGNHDLNNVGNANWANSAHIKTFVLPTNSPEPERYYSWEDGDALFISLDSDSCCNCRPEQLDGQPAGDEPAQVEVRLLSPYRVLVRQRRRLDRQ